MLLRSHPTRAHQAMDLCAQTGAGSPVLTLSHDCTSCRACTVLTQWPGPKWNLKAGHVSLGALPATLLLLPAVDPTAIHQI